MLGQRKKVGVGTCNPEDLWGCTVADQCCLKKHRSSTDLERFDHIMAKPRRLVKATEWAWLVMMLEDSEFLRLLLERQEPENITGLPDEHVTKVPFRALPTLEEEDDLEEMIGHLHEMARSN